MYSGYILVYAFNLNIEIICQIFEKFYEIDDEENYYSYNFLENINEILEEKGYKFINLIYKKCCYHNEEEVFLGVELGNTSFIYRNYVQNFITFDSYHQFYQNQLDEIKLKYTENEIEILKEFKDFANEYNIDDLGQPEFYTFANDCESCT